MPASECPYCEERVNVSGTPRLGQKITCPHCGENLEVVNLHPLELDYQDEDEYEEYGDWEEDDDEF